jgi:hypothetical protein
VAYGNFWVRDSCRSCSRLAALRLGTHNDIEDEVHVVDHLLPVLTPSSPIATRISFGGDKALRKRPFAADHVFFASGI